MTSLAHSFTEIASLIQQSRNNALRAVNAELVNLYWNVGAYISQKLQHSEWGDKTVSELAKYLKQNEPDLKGFDRRGLYRMVQFYETYVLEEFVSPLVSQIEQQQGKEIVSPVVTQLENQPETQIVSPVSRQFVPMDIRQTILGKVSWTNHLIIFTRCKMDVEREFYLRMSIKENYSVREHKDSIVKRGNSI